MKENCLFCKLSQKENLEERIYENKNFFSIPDINQQVPGHSLVISKEHFKTFLDLPIKAGEDLIDCIKETARIVLKKNNADGFNIVNNNSKSAGQIINHLHFHILPRTKNGKTPKVY